MPVLSSRGVPPSTQSKFSLWGWGVMYMWRAPNLAIPCVQLHWAASLHPIWSSYAKETRRKQHLPVLSTRGVPPSTVFRAPKNSHFGGAFYAVFRDDFTDLHENLQKRSSLVQEWRRRFEFLAFHLHSKKFQPDRRQTWLFFSHWKTLILEALSMPCSVTTSPISMKTCRKGHRWCKNGDAASVAAVKTFLF